MLKPSARETVPDAIPDAARNVKNSAPTGKSENRNRIGGCWIFESAMCCFAGITAEDAKQGKQYML